MIVLYILIAIALLICLLLSLRINLHIIYEDELKIYLRILFIKIPIVPEGDSGFDISKLRKKKKDTDEGSAEEDKAAVKASPSVIDKLNSVRKVISIFSDAFHKHLHVKLTKIHVRVATPDAAQTAILYGAISTAIVCIIEVIESITNLDRIKKSSISVEPDFLSEKTDIKLRISLYVSVFGAIKVLMKSFINYYSASNKTQIINRKENGNG